MRIFLEAALVARQPQAAQPVLALLPQTHLEDPEIARLAAEVVTALKGTHELTARSGPAS
jgi:hypothetical protein